MGVEDFFADVDFRIRLNLKIVLCNKIEFKSKKKFTFALFEMNLIGIVHKLPVLSSPDMSPGSNGLEKLLSDAILALTTRF